MPSESASANNVHHASTDQHRWEHSRANKLTIALKLSRYFVVQRFFRRHLEETLAVIISLSVCGGIFVIAWMASPASVNSMEGVVQWAMKGFPSPTVSSSGGDEGAVGAPVMVAAPKNFGCEMTTGESFDECLERRLRQEILWRSLHQFNNGENIAVFQLYPERPLLLSRKSGPKQL